MPAFTLIEKQYRGKDLVEILKDDQPFWDNLPGRDQQERSMYGRIIVV